MSDGAQSLKPKKFNDLMVKAGAVAIAVDKTI